MKLVFKYRILKAVFILILFTYANFGSTQNHQLTIKVIDSASTTSLDKVIIVIDGKKTSPDAYHVGDYFFKNISAGNHTVLVFKLGYRDEIRTVQILSDTVIELSLSPLEKSLKPFELVVENASEFSLTRLGSVEGTAIYAGKKNEVILLNKLDANLATNNSRQVYAKIAGLNIWESDGGGLQLGIGGRGLSPNRTSNFNTRQNGYDISADALGYPESYYTPSTEALERIEIIRGASSLQYGTQFGGVVNFVMKKGPENKKIEVLSRNTMGSFGLFNSFTGLGGTVKRLNYFTAYQFKTGKGWRENSEFNQHQLFSNFNFSINEKMEIGLDYTYMTYLSKQAGGLTDEMFESDPVQSIRTRNWMEVKWNLFALTYNYKISSKDQFNLRAFGLLADRNTVGFLGAINRLDPMAERDIIKGNFKNIGAELRYLHRYNFVKKPAVVLGGIRIYQGKTSNKQGLGTSNADADFHFLNPENLEGSDYLFPSINFSAFIENVFFLSEKLSITPGVRLEYIDTKAEGYYKQIEKDLAGNIIFENNVTTISGNNRTIPLAGIGISLKPNKNLESYANISQNYRAINFSDLQIVNPNFKVDPSMEDEYGYTADLGLRGVWKSFLNYDVSVFYINYKNRIGEIYKSDPNTLQIFRYRTNIGNSYNVGVEAFFELNILKMINDSAKNSLSIFTNTSWIRANYLENEEAAISNKKVEFVPEITNRSGISFRSKKFSSTFQFSYTGLQFSDATNADYSPNAVIGEIPAYWVMDLSFSYTFKFLKLETGINNLSNQVYFTRRASGFPGPGLMPADPRNFYVSLQIKI